MANGVEGRSGFSLTTRDLVWGASLVVGMALAWARVESRIDISQEQRQQDRAAVERLETSLRDANAELRGLYDLSSELCAARRRDDLESGRAQTVDCGRRR